MISRDPISPRVSERASKKFPRVASMDTLQEVVDSEQLEGTTPCAEADEAMVWGKFAIFLAPLYCSKIELVYCQTCIKCIVALCFLLT